MASTQNQFEIFKRVSQSSEDRKKVLEEEEKEYTKGVISKKLKKKMKKMEKRGMLLKFHEPAALETYQAVFGKDVKAKFTLCHDEYLRKLGRSSLAIRDIRDLILFLRGSSLAAKWISESMPFLSQQVCVKILGSGRGERAFPAIRSLLVSEGGGNRNKRKRRRSSAEAQGMKLEEMILSEEEMIENEIYVSSLDIPECKGCKWIDTSSSGSDSRGNAVFALDCEMCLTAYGLELARVTLVDYESGVVSLDMIVKPTHEITDYLTKYSGITADIIEKTDFSLSDAQQSVCELIKEDTILIGHSLENDLRALKIIHRKIIDTSVIFPHNQPGMKHSLKSLSRQILKREIQRGEHDSAEDALACVDLVKKKVSLGNSCKMSERELLLQQISSSNFHPLLIDKAHNIKGCTTQETPNVPINNDEEAFVATKENLQEKRVDFICTHLMSFLDILNDKVETSTDERDENLEGRQIRARNGVDMSTSGIQEESKDVEKEFLYETHLSNMDDQIKQCAAVSQPNTLFLVLGLGNIKKIQQLHATRNNTPERWMDRDAERLASLARDAKDGICFLYFSNQ